MAHLLAPACELPRRRTAPDASWRVPFPAPPAHEATLPAHLPAPPQELPRRRSAPDASARVPFPAPPAHEATLPAHLPAACHEPPRRRCSAPEVSARVQFPEPASDLPRRRNSAPEAGARVHVDFQLNPELPWKLELSPVARHNQEPSPLSSRAASGQWLDEALFSDVQYVAPTRAYLLDETAKLAPATPWPMLGGLAFGKKPASSSGSETASTGAPEEEADNLLAEAAHVSAAESPVSRVSSGGTRADQTLDSLSSEGFTTLMIRNLPHNIVQADLIRELDRSGFQDLHDFVYMPSVFSSGRGKGYAFVNFVNSEAARLFMSSWHKSHRFAAAKHKKTLDISVACLQGREANVLKWDDSKRRRVINPNYRPVVRTDGAAAQQPSPSTVVSSPPPGLEPPGLELPPYTPAAQQIPLSEMQWDATQTASIAWL